MNLNRERIKKLLDEKFEGNYHRLARALGVDTAHIHRYLTKGVGGGKKLLAAFFKYCKENGLRVEDYFDI